MAKGKQSDGAINQTAADTRRRRREMAADFKAAHHEAIRILKTQGKKPNQRNIALLTSERKLVQRPMGPKQKK